MERKPPKGDFLSIWQILQLWDSDHHRFYNYFDSIWNRKRLWLGENRKKLIKSPEKTRKWWGHSNNKGVLMENTKISPKIRQFIGWFKRKFQNIAQVTPFKPNKYMKFCKIRAIFQKILEIHPNDQTDIGNCKTLQNLLLYVPFKIEKR